MSTDETLDPQPADPTMGLGQKSAQDLFRLATSPDQTAATYQCIAKILFARMMRSGQQVRDLRAFLIDQTAEATRMLLTEPEHARAVVELLDRIASITKVLNGVTTCYGGTSYATD